MVFAYAIQILAIPINFVVVRPTLHCVTLYQHIQKCKCVTMTPCTVVPHNLALEQTAFHVIFTTSTELYLHEQQDGLPEGYQHSPLFQSPTAKFNLWHLSRAMMQCDEISHPHSAASRWLECHTTHEPAPTACLP